MNKRDRLALYRRVADNIRAKRQREGITQEGLAKAIRRSRTSVNNIEAYRQHPPLDVLVDIAEALDTPLWRLIR